MFTFIRVISVVLLLAISSSISLADGLGATMQVEVKRTFAVKTDSGHRIVESLRFHGNALASAALSQTESNQQALLVKLVGLSRSDLLAKNVRSAIFKSVRVAYSKNRQSIRVEFVPALHQERVCASELQSQVLFVVCTQEFSNADSAKLRNVKVSQDNYKVKSAKTPVVPHYLSEPTMDMHQVRSFKEVPLHEAKENSGEVLSVSRPVPEVEQAFAFAPGTADISTSRRKLLKSQPVEVLSSKQSGKGDRNMERVDTFKRVHTIPSSEDRLVKEPSSVHSIEFFGNTDKQLASLNFDNDFHYTSLQKQSGVYNIFIPDADVAHQGLLKPFFAPQNVLGIELIHIKKSSGGLVITIHSSDRLKIEQIKNSMIIKLK